MEKYVGLLLHLWPEDVFSSDFHSVCRFGTRALMSDTAYMSVFVYPPSYHPSCWPNVTWHCHATRPCSSRVLSAASISYGRLMHASVCFTCRCVLSLEQDAPGRAGKGGHYPVMMSPNTAAAGPAGPAADPQEPALIHWCHGAPGAVYLFTKAAEVLPEVSCGGTKMQLCCALSCLVYEMNHCGAVVCVALAACKCSVVLQIGTWMLDGVLAINKQTTKNQ